MHESSASLYNSIHASLEGLDIASIITSIVEKLDETQLNLSSQQRTVDKEMQFNSWLTDFLEANLMPKE